MSSARDYTDSESESEDAAPTPLRSAKDTHRPPQHRSNVQSQQSSTTHSETGNPSLRITLRPNLTHLMNESHRSSASASPPPEPDVDRLSLSPPPPIKLKLGMKHALNHQVAYSDSEESDAPKHDRSPPPKRQKKSRSSKNQLSAGPTMPAQHRKSYDWLQPSSAAASHHGPPEREKPAFADDVDMKSTGWEASDDGQGSSDMLALPQPYSSPVAGEVKPKKARRKADPSSASGPGKNWRKGIKKGDPLPWKDGVPILGDPRMISVLKGSSMTPQQPLSAEGSPEPMEGTPFIREQSPPFVLADAVKLGFPVFSKPIASPKVTLGPFPKVTSFFAPFDQKPFHKETVRNWSNSEKVLPGIAGGQLKFRTWQRGPTSELGHVIQALKEEKAELAARKKSQADTSVSSERPPITHSVSSESVIPSAGASVPPTERTGEDADEATGSDVGDGEESLAGSVREVLPVPTRGRGGASKRGRPRKSKLAQEIIPNDPEEPASEVLEVPTRAASVESGTDLVEELAGEE